MSEEKEAESKGESKGESKESSDFLENELLMLVAGQADSKVLYSFLFSAHHN